MPLAHETGIKSNYCKICSSSKYRWTTVPTEQYFKRSPSAAFITGTKKATEVAIDYFQSYAALLSAISTTELYPWL